MNIQFNTKDDHSGTIKPVQSTTGQHAGKWICRISGPKVAGNTLSSGCKIVYSAPYIGAAKAAIAKFLNIKVSDVETDVPSTYASHTPQQGEFDDNDDDLANFDLNAAVSSAKKQQTPPSSNHYQKKIRSSSCKSIPSNPYQSGTPTKLNLSSGLDYNKAMNNKLPSKPPPQYPNPKTKSSPNLPPQYPNPNQKIKIDLNEYKVLREEAEALRQEKHSLEKDISTAKQKKKDLDKDIIFTRTENDMLKKESKSLRQQMKGGREDHTKMKSDLKSAKEEYTTVKSELKMVKAEHKTVKSDLKSAKMEKEKFEKEARIAREEKGRYEKEVNAIKAELDSLKKEKQSAVKARAKSTGEDADQPPKKKQKTGAKTGAKGTTIIKSMKVGDLKDEAAARGIDVTGMNKNRLLDRLGVGSVLIHKTDEWKEVWGEVVLLRDKFKKERQVDVQMEQERQHQLLLRRQQKQTKEDQERQKREQEEEKKERAAELASQVEKHKHHYPKVHGCKLAKTDELMYHGEPRSEQQSTCSECHNRLIKRLVFNFSGAPQKCHGYTCEGCDYDICQDCFKENTMTPDEKKAEATRKAKEEKERRKREEEEEAQHRAKWDAKQQFKSSIINPPDKNLDPDGNKTKGFTVWCSDGYGNDGWHSYEGPPTKEFDATYKTKEEANNRARYLFHWKNPWGLDAEEIAENSGEIYKSVRNELVTYEVTPDDSTTWTVGVVPDAAYSHLDNARSRRHDYDREYGSRESYEPGMGELFY